MRAISISKFEVGSSFSKYNYPLYSLVIVHEDGNNVIGKIINYTRQGTGIIVKSSTGKEHILSPASIVYYEDPKVPAVSLKYVEKETYKLLNYYKKHYVLLNDEDAYYVMSDYNVRFETEFIDAGGLGRSTVACVNRDSLIYLIPYLQHSSKKQVDDVIKHEVAHALTPGEGHNEIWRDVCLAIGGNGEATIKVPEESYTKIPKTWADPTNSVPEALWADMGRLFEVYTYDFSLPTLANNLSYDYNFISAAIKIEKFLDLEKASESVMAANTDLVKFVQNYIHHMLVLLHTAHDKYTARDIYRLFRIDREDLKSNINLIVDIKQDFDKYFKEYM